MKTITRPTIFAILICCQASCACNHWQLTAQGEAVNREWTMDVCSDWIHEGLTITRQSKLNAVERANYLLQTASKNELHGCHVVPGTLAFSEGPIAAMRVECSQSLRGIEQLPRTRPRQYVIKLEKQQGLD